MQGTKITKERDNWHECPAINAMVHFIPTNIRGRKNLPVIEQNSPMISYVETQGALDPMFGGPTRGRR